MWKEVKTHQNENATSHLINSAATTHLQAALATNPKTVTVDPNVASFEAGQIFSKFDLDGDGKLNKLEFESLIKSYPELMKASGIAAASMGGAGTGTFGGAGISVGSYPVEIISGRMLTHYDETAGIAIPRSAIEQHKSMGNTILPLLESYKSRYDRLRALLTGRLFPKREHLLQLRRQLQNCSAEVTAVRKGIERETLTDTEQILERLRTAESMRQSSINHQVLQIEEELEAIERIIRRVELANRDDTLMYPSIVSGQKTSGSYVTSALSSDVPVDVLNVPKAANMIEIIQQFPDLSTNIEKLATKPVSVQVDFPTNDFPRETAERLEIISHCDRYMHALSVKDHMLWSSLSEQKRAEEMLEDERKLSHEYANEIGNWAEMVQSLNTQVGLLKSEKTKSDALNQKLLQTLRNNNIYFVIEE